MRATREEQLSPQTATKRFPVVELLLALVVIPVAISLLLKRDTFPTSPADKHYRLFCNRMARLGLQRRPGESESVLLGTELLLAMSPDGEFLYAIRLPTSDESFNYCPADGCNVENPDLAVEACSPPESNRAGRRARCVSCPRSSASATRSPHSAPLMPRAQTTRKSLLKKWGFPSRQPKKKLERPGRMWKSPKPRRKPVQRMHW